MDVNQDWKKNLLNQLDAAIERGNVDKETLELMKELLKNARVKTSITEYFKDQE